MAFVGDKSRDTALLAAVDSTLRLSLRRGKLVEQVVKQQADSSHTANQTSIRDREGDVPDVLEPEVGPRHA